MSKSTDEALNDPRVSAFRQKVKLAVVPDTPVPDVRLDVIYVDGRTEEIQVKDARGTDNRPLTDQEIEEKFRTLAATYAPDCGEAEKLIDAVWSLENADDVSRMMAYAVPAS